MGEMDRRPDSAPDPAQLRVSDADRHKVADILREAAGEGRLDIEELDQRLEATFAARTYADLVPLTADLPVSRTHAPPVRRPAAQAPAGPTHDSSFAMMSGTSRKGAWTIGPTHTAFSLMGGVDLDLREATFTSKETVINASTIMGGVDITVNARTHVVVEGMGIMGGYDQGRDKVEAVFDDDSPVVRVRGFALMGGVSVSRKGPPRPRKLKKLLGGS